MHLPCKHVSVSFHYMWDWKQNYAQVTITNDAIQRDFMWYNCNMPGHPSGRFPLSYLHRTRTQSLQLGYYFSQNKAVQKDLINLNWIVFESCLTVSSVMNPYIISEINYCHPNTSIHVFTNVGNLDYNQSSTMYLFPLIVFYNPDCISNILALIDVTSQFRAYCRLRQIGRAS